MKPQFLGNMRKFIISVVLIFCALAVNAQGIKNAADLVAFVEAINGGQPIDQWKNDKGEICLESDIDMAKVKKMNPISSFGGVFDGKGYSLINWKAKNGLFDCLLQGGVIRNLNIAQSCSMKATNSGEEYFLGFIVNRNHGLVENCENRGTISHKSPYSAEPLYIGGVVGSNRWMVVKCRNYGDVSSASVSTKQEEQLIVSVGGVVGGGYAKSELKASIIWCENYGKVTYGGDFPVSYVGGIVGHTYGATVKYCVNRGEVNGSSNLAEIPAKALNTHVAGVCAFSKADFVGCDNFGKVVSSGSHAATVAGILGMAHSQMVVADCVNYGDVSLSNERPSVLAGIVGTAGRPVHVVNCDNHGKVTYEGYSPDRPSFVGGIVGDIYTKKEFNKAAYVRGCVNYGDVFSAAGGNNYTNDRSIHTGGVVGKAYGNASVEAVIRDCANKGKVSAVSGKKNPIVGSVNRAKVAGEYVNTYAESVEPLADGANIYGRVCLTDGSPLAGVVVSDGRQCVATAEDGTYSMIGDLTETRFVYISLPDGYEAANVNSFPQIFRRVHRHEKAVKADFTLSKRADSCEEYTMVMIGDPQMRGLGFDNSGESFRDVVIPDIEKFKADKKNFFAINLGDLVYNWMHGYDDYLDICSTTTFPMYNVVGNHDLDQSNLYDLKLGTGFYESYVSPTYYSFTIGGVHYIFLNTIMADPKDPNAKLYSYGITDDQLEWLKNDLKFVPKDMTLAVCSHALLFHDGMRYREKRYRNFKQFRELLAPYSKIYAWGGHSHINYGCEYSWDKGKMTSVTVARCNGVLRSNLELTNDGTPNGYMVVSVKDGQMSWYYQAVGQEARHQMRVYSPTRTESEYVKAVIWNHTPGFWGNPQWYEDGVLKGELEPIKEKDPDYLELFKGLGHLKGRAMDYAKPADSQYMFRIKPSEGVRKGEVRVVDNFGVTYVQSVEW